MKFIKKMIVFCLAATVYGQFDQFEVKPLDRQARQKAAVEVYDSNTLDRELRKQIEQQHLPGLATCIVKNDRIIWQGCYGYADFNKNLLVNESTAFRLASVSKTFTATAVMQLWQQGLIDLDANINGYLPSGTTVINPWHPDSAITCRILPCRSSGFGCVVSE